MQRPSIKLYLEAKLAMHLLQVPNLVFGGGTPGDGEPNVMLSQPQDPESWNVQVWCTSKYA